MRGALAFHLQPFIQSTLTTDRFSLAQLDHNSRSSVFFGGNRVFRSCKIGHELFDLTNVLQNMFSMFPNAGSKDKTETTLKENVPQKIRVGEYLIVFLKRSKYQLQLLPAENPFQLQQSRSN